MRRTKPCLSGRRRRRRSGLGWCQGREVGRRRSTQASCNPHTRHRMSVNYLLTIPPLLAACIYFAISANKQTNKVNRDESYPLLSGLNSADKNRWTDWTHKRENNYSLQTFGLGNTDSEYKDPHPIIDMRSIYKFVTVQCRFGVS